MSDAERMKHAREMAIMRRQRDEWKRIALELAHLVDNTGTCYTNEGALEMAQRIIREEQG